jgi:hypothetical protein
MKKIYHTTKMEQTCPICNQQFIYYWYDKEEKNGYSERMYGINECHKQCLEEQSGIRIKTLQELNNERKLIY